MIKSLEIKNFKSIKNAHLDMKRFNLLCGDNASGKTTIIHSILALIQRNDQSRNLDGDLVKIGEFSEIRNKETGEDISIELTTTMNKIKTIYLKKNTNPNIDETSIFKEVPKKKLDIIFEKTLFYLSSNRIGVVDIYNKSNSKFGISGEAFVDYLSSNQNKPLNSDYIAAFSSLFPAITVINRYLDHVRFWLKHIADEEVNLEQIPFTNQYVLTFGNTQEKNRPINTGSGLSFILPIIVMCLGSLIISNEPIIIIENPEVFLHPKAQVKLTQFLILISEFSQIIIETHSDHVLKTVIEKLNINNEIFVFDNKTGSTVIKTLNHSDFKLHPTSYAEIQYRAFDLLSIELHIILYSTLHARHIYGQQHLNRIHRALKHFDDYLSTLTSHDLIKQRTYGNRVYNTLPTYIRNCIDHPEQIDPVTNQVYTYSYDELRKSIEFLFALI